MQQKKRNKHTKTSSVARKAWQARFRYCLDWIPKRGTCQVERGCVSCPVPVLCPMPDSRAKLQAAAKWLQRAGHPLMKPNVTCQSLC